MNSSPRIAIAILLIVALPMSLLAQKQGRGTLPQRKEFNSWSIGVSAGPTIFQGDINARVLEESISDLSYGLSITKNLTHSFGLSLSGLRGNLSGETASEEFVAPFTEVTLNAVYTVGNISFLKRNQNFNIFLQAGGGIIDYKSEVKRKKTGLVIRQQNQIGEFILPIGVGAKYRLGRHFHVNAMFTYKKTLSEKLDATFRNLSEFDGYSWMTLGLTYTIGKQKQALEWSNPLNTLYSDISDMRMKMDNLSNDKDGDGVADIFDKDNSTPEGVKVYGDGTAIDNDGDGIPDHLDEEPFTAKGAKVDNKGKAVDSDGDGVPDFMDLEADTPAGTLVNFQGKSIPRDGTDGSGGAAGASAAYLPSIFFDTNKSVILYKYYDRLANVALLMKNNPDVNLTLTGNADIRGGEGANNKLSQQRAESVKDHLVKIYGIDASRFKVESKGEKDPLAKTSDDMNRRVDFSTK